MTTKKQVSELLRAVTARFPGSKLAEENLEAFKADWEKLIREFGLNRFNMGLQRTVMSTSFFPSLSDIRKHIPTSDPRYSDWKPSPEDLRRKASGERSYGEGDILALWKMFQAMRKKLGRALTEREQVALVDELDRRRDVFEGKAPAKVESLPDQKMAGAGE
jgi:hypothetical protein